MSGAYSFRVPEDIKNQAFEVIKNYGLTPTQAINMFLREIALTHTIPLRLDYQPKPETIAAMQAANRGEVEMLAVDTVDEAIVLMQKMAQETKR